MNAACSTLDFAGDLFKRRSPRVNILGVGVSAIDMDEAVRQSDELIRSQGTGYICVSDVHSVIEGFRDPSLRKILNNSFLTTPDGMPLVWLGQLAGAKNMHRVYGPDFLVEMCRLSVVRGYSNFFYGGRPGVAETLSVRLKQRFQGLNVVGVRCPPFRPLSDAETQELTAQMSEIKPDIFWVGLGSPKQERFMAQHYDRLACNLMVGVGAAFDFHSGAVKEAPRWLHRTGLQWVHRLMQEPGRLGRRYLNCIPDFLWNAGLQMTGLRRFELDDA